MRIGLFGWTLLVFRRRDDALDALRREIKASEGYLRYIKQLEMGLDRKNEVIAGLKRRTAFTVAYVPSVAAAVPAEFPVCMCEVCEKFVPPLFTIDPTYPHGEIFCQGH